MSKVRFGAPPAPVLVEDAERVAQAAGDDRLLLHEAHQARELMKVEHPFPRNVSVTDVTHVITDVTHVITDGAAM